MTKVEAVTIKVSEESLKSVDDRITPEQHEALWNGAMQMLCHAQETAFRLGWEMRGQV